MIQTKTLRCALMPKNPNHKVFRERQKIEKKISALQDQLKQLREECGHPNVEKKHWSDTGNYDRSMDCFGTDYTCPDCGKRWSVSTPSRIYYNSLTD